MNQKSQPGIKAWLSHTGSLSTVQPSSSTANRWTEGRFLTKDDLIKISLDVAAEIYAKQGQELSGAKIAIQKNIILP